MTARGGDRPGALEGLRVLDCGVLFAGPITATMLADFGADVIKVEHPAGDPLRTLGWQKDGVSLWWAHVNRNKRYVSLNLSKPQGAALLKELVREADVLIESFRPGRMERWGLSYDELAAINPELIMVRVTGFGQTGPYAERPGFGTVAEAMSGYAYTNGFPDHPPSLPSFAMGDGVCALFERVEERGLLAADVGAGAGVDDQLDVDAGPEDVGAEVAGLVGLTSRGTQPAYDVQHLTAYVDEGGLGPDRVRRDDDALDQRVGRGHHERDVLAGARLGLVGVDHEVPGLGVVLRDEAPLHARGEACAAAATQAGVLDQRDDVVGRILSAVSSAE